MTSILCLAVVVIIIAVIIIRLRKRKSIKLAGSKTPSLCCKASWSDEDRIAWVLGGACIGGQYCGPGTGSASYCVENTNCCSSDHNCLYYAFKDAHPDYLNFKFNADNSCVVTHLKSDGTQEIVANSTDWTITNYVQILSFLPGDKLKFTITNSGGAGGLIASFFWHGIADRTNGARFPGSIEVPKATWDWYLNSEVNNNTPVSQTYDSRAQWIWTPDNCPNCTREFIWSPPTDLSAIIGGNNGTCPCSKFCGKNWNGQLPTDWSGAKCSSSVIDPAWYDPDNPDTWNAGSAVDCNNTASYFDPTYGTITPPLICSCNRDDTVAFGVSSDCND